MNFTALPYLFHDAILVDYQKENKNQFSLIVDLYELYYPNKETLKLTFSGVFNQETMGEFMSELQEMEDDGGIYGTRINNIQFDTKKKSEENDLYFFIDIDYSTSVRIHCKKINISYEKRLDLDELLQQKETFWQIYETFCVAGCCGLSAFDFSDKNTKIAIREFGKDVVLKYLNDLITVTRSNDDFIYSQFLNEKMEKEKYIQLFKNLIGMINSI